MPSIKETIIKNTLWLSSAQFFSSVLTYFLIVIIARSLGDVSFGEYSFLFSFTALTFIFSDFGLNILFMKEAARDNSKLKDYFNSMITLKIFLGIFSIILTLVISYLFYSVNVNLILVIFISFFMVMSDFFSYSFNTINKTEISSISIFFERIIALALSIYFIYLGKGLVFILTGLLVSYFAKTLYLYIKLAMSIKITFEFNASQWKTMIISALPFFLTSIFIFLYFRIDTVILHFMTSDQYVGWYTASYKFLDALILIPQLLILAIFPSMSRLFIENKLVLKDLFNRTFRYLLILGVPITIGIFMLSRRLIEFIYGSRFSESTLILQIIILSIPFIFINYLIGNLLVSIDKQKYFTIITAICALINIILNIILIHYYSYIGAAIATVITEVINLVLLAYFSGKFILDIPIFKITTLKVIIASITMAIIIYNIQFMHIILITLIGAFSYFLILFVLGMEKEDKDIIHLLKKKLFNF